MVRVATRSKSSWTMNYVIYASRGGTTRAPAPFGHEDEVVESIPCHGRVSRCESGYARHFEQSSAGYSKARN